MNLKHVPLIIFMIIAYALVIRGIFAWYALLVLGDPYLLGMRFRHLSVNTVQQLEPYIVAIACVIGLHRRQLWAWWLSFVAVGYELVVYAPEVPRFFEPSTAGAAGLFKFAWLIALMALLLLARKK